MGCLKLKYLENPGPLKVVYSAIEAEQKPAQRFWSVDPLAHEFPWQSPYSAFDGNPVFFTDPTGMASEKHDPPMFGGSSSSNKQGDPPAKGTESKLVTNPTYLPCLSCPVKKPWEGEVYSGPNFGTANLFPQRTEADAAWNWIKRDKIGSYEPGFWENLKNSESIIFRGVYDLSDAASTFVQGWGGGTVRHLDGSQATPNERVNNFVSLASNSVFFMRGLNTLPSLLTTPNTGFLGFSVTVRTPFAIPVQRFGTMSVTDMSAFGLRVGSSKLLNRTFHAITPEFNNLTVYTIGTIPKGTPIRLGVVGPQSFLYPGGLLQFNVKPHQVTNQVSRFIPR